MKRIIATILLVVFTTTGASAFNGTPIANVIDKVVAIGWTNSNEEAQSDPGGLGTGFVVDAKEGYIVTNHHVIEGAIRLGEEVLVSFYSGVDFDDPNDAVPATIVGYDKNIDIAVLQVSVDTIKDRNIRAIQWDTTYELGDDVYIIGHPNGLYWSVSKGILSNLHRRGIDQETGSFQYWQRLLQTDASLNSGNSGGPAFDRNGKVSGVAVSIISPNGGSIGLNMMIEGYLAKRVVEDIIEYGEYRLPFFGISFDTSRFDDEGEEDYRVFVKNIIEGSSVHGLFQSGDEIVKFDKFRIFTLENLYFYISYLHVGDTIDFTIIRDGEEMEIRNVLIKPRPPEPKPDFLS